MKAQLRTYFYLILVILIFGIAIYITELVINNAPGIIPSQVIYIETFTKQFFDNTIFFLLMIIIFIELIASWINPNKLLAGLNLIGIFILGYLKLSFNTLLAPVNNSISTNTLLPNSYTLITSSYITVIIFFALVIGIIFNLRDKNEEVNQ